MFKGKKLSLNLAGGGARGQSQAAYIQAFVDLGLEPDMLFGSSVGALNGCLYLQGEMDRLKELWMTVKSENVYQVNYLMLPNLPYGQNAVFNPAPLRKLIDKYVDFNKIKNSPIPFTIGVTNLTDSTSEAYLAKDLDEATFKRVLLAGASPPMAFPPVELKPGVFYGDSGVCNNFRAGDALKAGAESIVILSPTTAEKHVTKNIFSMFDILSSVPMYTDLEREVGFIEKINDLQAVHSDLRHIELCVVKPAQPTGVALLDFDYKGKDRQKLWNEAYLFALEKLQEFKNR